MGETFEHKKKEGWYSEGEIPLAYEHFFEDGTTLEASQNEEGIARITIKNGDRVLFDASRAVPEGYLLVTPTYQNVHFGRLTGPSSIGRWHVEHERKLIHVGEFRDERDLLTLFHEIGHARNDTPQQIRQFRELDEEIYRAKIQKDRDHEVLLEEEKARLHGTMERRAWAYAISALRRLQEDGFNWREIFPRRADLLAHVHARLGSYGHSYAEAILERDPAFKRELERLFGKIGGADNRNDSKRNNE